MNRETTIILIWGVVMIVLMAGVLSALTQLGDTCCNQFTMR